MIDSTKNKILLSLFSTLAFAQSSLAIETVFPNIIYQSLQTNKPVIINKNTKSSAINGLLSTQESLSEIRFSNDSTLTIDDNKFYGYVTTSTPGAGQIDFKIRGAISASLGNEDQPLGLIVFDSDAKIYGNAYAQVIEVGSDATVTFNNNINAKPGSDKKFITTKVAGGSIYLTGIRATVVFGEGTYVGSTIRSDVSGQGSVRFTGNAFVNKIGGIAGNRIDRVIFYVPDTIAKLNDNIYARTMNADDVTLDINKDLILDIINYSSSKSSIKLNENTLLLRGNFKLEGTNTINTKIINGNIGNIIIDGDTSKLDLSIANLVVNLAADSTSVLAQNGTIKTYTLFNSTNNGIIIPSQQQVSFNIINEYNRYIKWSYDQETHTIFLENNLGNLVSDIQNSGADPVTIELAQILTQAPILNSDALELLNAAAVMPPDQAAILLDNIIPDLLSTEEVVDQNNAQVNRSYFNRMMTVINDFKSKLFSENYGVAAGEEASRYGAWLMPFYGQSVQKARKLNDGYKTHSYGATLGLDTRFDETLTLGFGASHIHSAVKNTRDYVQDRGIVNSYIFSLYGRFDLPQNWFIQGLVSYGKSFTRNTETRKITSSVTELAKAKYNTNNYSVQLLLGNDYQITEFSALTPMIGLRYDRFNSSNYRETGTSNEHLSVYKKPVNRVEGIIGGKIDVLFNIDKIIIKPVIQGFINNNFTNKKAVTITTLDGLATPLPSRAEKPERLSYDLSAGANIEYKNLELGIIHEIELERKFISHQTMLKLKVNL